MEAGRSDWLETFSTGSEDEEDKEEVEEEEKSFTVWNPTRGSEWKREKWENLQDRVTTTRKENASELQAGTRETKEEEEDEEAGSFWILMWNKPKPEQKYPHPNKTRYLYVFSLVDIKIQFKFQLTQSGRDSAATGWQLILCRWSEFRWKRSKSCQVSQNKTFQQLNQKNFLKQKMNKHLVKTQHENHPEVCWLELNGQVG